MLVGPAGLRDSVLLRPAVQDGNAVRPNLDSAIQVVGSGHEVQVVASRQQKHDNPAPTHQGRRAVTPHSVDCTAMMAETQEPRDHEAGWQGARARLANESTISGRRWRCGVVTRGRCHFTRHRGGRADPQLGHLLKVYRLSGAPFPVWPEFRLSSPFRAAKIEGSAAEGKGGGCQWAG